MTRPRQSRRGQSRRGLWRIFAWPLAIFAASTTGLVLGLLGDGWRDALAWLLLGGGPFAVACHLLNRTYAKEPR